MYQTEFNGEHHELGTSGFLYRSNKLMYDHATKSMWSTLKGEPVIGPLVDKGIKLNRRHVVTSTWGEWKAKHPETIVLTLNTGHTRDYGEGVAYNAYFADDKLMFDVPKNDDRLKNKDEVFALRDDTGQLAISADFLAKTPVYHDQIGDTKIVVLTDSSGANRGFASGDVVFTKWDGNGSATDDKGQTWQVTEAALEMGETKLVRMPSHRVFWFGWQAQFPDTRLVK